MSPDAAATLARRIGDALADPFEIVPGHEVVVTSSIGIAINRDPSTEPGTLLANADAAMYESRTRGRSRYSFFAPEMRTRASDRLELESELRSALSEGASMSTSNRSWSSPAGVWSGCRPSRAGRTRSAA